MSTQEINVFESEHLLKSEQVKLGSFYTPEKIVNAVHSLISNYKKYPQAVILDNAAGAGAFIKENDSVSYKAVEWDPLASEFLKKKHPATQLFVENAILNVYRKKYHISESDFLIQIGNPPYNDVTSAYRNRKKGENICDPDLFDRDLGISFLKSYNKLKSEVICVLHPLSYLIKEANFKRLKSFAQNYQLKKCILFSSMLFKKVSNTHFPIAIALYRKDSKGMTYDYIRDFKFSILDRKIFFKLNQYKTVDSFIKKYPPPKTASQTSDIGLYYYTFRDINSLLRNTAFHTQKNSNSIVVHLENLYQYAYLWAFKKLFRPKDLWLYGNLSPLGDEQTVKKHKKLFLEYAFLSEKKAFSQLSQQYLDKLFKFYSLQKDKKRNLKAIEKKVNQIISQII